MWQKNTIWKKLILDLSWIKAVCIFFLFRIVAKTKHDNREGKKFHVTQHVGRFWREWANLSNYTFHTECIALFMIFILLYLCCVCGIERMNVCLWCLIFVNSFYKNTKHWMMKADNYTRKKTRNYEFIKG